MKGYKLNALTFRQIPNEWITTMFWLPIKRAQLCLKRWKLRWLTHLFLSQLLIQKLSNKLHTLNLVPFQKNHLMHCIAHSSIYTKIIIENNLTEIIDLFYLLIQLIQSSLIQTVDCIQERNTQFYLTYQIVSVIQRFNMKGWFYQNAFKLNFQLEISSSLTDLQSVLLQSLNLRNGQGFFGDGTLHTNVRDLPLLS